MMYVISAQEDCLEAILSNYLRVLVRPASHQIYKQVISKFNLIYIFQILKIENQVIR